MIINMSRAGFFQQCRRKTYNMFVLGQEPHQTPEPLAIGGAYHIGVAALTAKRDRALALETAEAHYRDRIKDEKLLPEELRIAEKNIELVKRMIHTQADMYEKDDWILLQPEVEFCVPLPNTTHHCLFVHNLLYPESSALHKTAEVAACEDLRCYVPHYLKGRADGLIAWKNMLWIMERKTSGLLGDMFWQMYQLDAQCTAYIYGTWKSIGQKPHGFILEKVTKPRKNAADPFHITVEREPYLRSDSDLKDFEEDIINVANDYEQAWLTSSWYKNTKACFNFNRRCYFHDQCKRNYETVPGEFRQRPTDYVELEYYKLLGLPVPEAKPQEELHEADTF